MHDRSQSGAEARDRLAYKPGEVATQLGVSTRSVYRLINRGELRRVRLAGRWMVLAEDLDAFVENLKAGAAA